MAKGKAQIVGWRYFLGMHMVLCHGPVDEIQAISFGDREAWAGSRVGSGDIYVNNPELFGGKQREGGVVGTIHVAMGESTQGQNGYLVSQLGSNVPAYRGVLSLIFNHFEIGSNNPYLKTLAVRFKRIYQGWSTGAAWNPSKADIGGAMNAAHIVYECITNTEWGMGYPSSSIDDPQFTDTADTLYAEGFGLCLLWNSQAKIEDFIGDVVDHIGAVLRVDPLTGKFQLKLIRDGYLISSLHSFNEDNISSITGFQRPNWGETTNEIVVGYTDMLSGTKKITAIQDLSNIAIQGSVVSATREYPGIVSDDIAGRVALRDLRAASTPLAKLTMTTNRTGVNLTIGDVALFSWLDYGIIEMPIRILNISQGTLVDGTIQIEAVEDIFGMPSTSYVKPQPVEWVDPSTPPVAIVDYKLIEVPYWEVARSASTADFNTLDDLSAFMSSVADSPSVGMYSFNMSFYDGASGTYLADVGSDFCPTCLTDSSISYDNTTVAYTSEVSISSVALGTYGYIGEECIVITGINTTTKLLTIKRGMMDTVPAVHNSGTRIWFTEDFTATSPIEYLQGDNVNTKLLTVSSFGELDPSLTPAWSKSMEGRFGKPYPPARVRLNGLEYPDVVYDNIVTTWVHRDRTTQTGVTLIDQYAGSIGPEVGTTYNIRYYKQVTGVLLDSFLNTPLLTHSAGLPVGSYFVRIEIESVVDGRVSWQKHSIITLLVRPTQTRITEDGVPDRRVLEDGVSVRVTE